MRNSTTRSAKQRRGAVAAAAKKRRQPVAKRAVRRATRHRKPEAAAPMPAHLPVNVDAITESEALHGMIDDAEMLPPTRAVVQDSDRIDWVEGEEDEAPLLKEKGSGPSNA